MPTRHSTTRCSTLVLTFAASLLAAGSQAQTPAPLAQYWVDAATHSLSIPGMEDAGSGGLMGAMMGNSFGDARTGGRPGRLLDLALFARNKPGADGTHSIPPALNMGDSLPLVAPKGTGRVGTREGEESMEKPKGRILLYWGCGDAVRSGQPRVLDFSKSSVEEWGKFMWGRSAPERGAQSRAGHAIWPNERERKQVPRDGSLVGNHAVSGDGVPASMKFAVPQGNDFMTSIRMSAAGNPKDAVTVGWNAIDQAGAYFVTAMGSKGSGDAADLVLWSSSDVAEPGWGLMDYLPPSLVTRYLGEKVLLPTGTLQCVIPKGIFAEADGAMVRMIAYGPELNVAFPPRPTRAGAPWNPEWTVRVRTKSTSMTTLGAEESSSNRGGSRAGRTRDDAGSGRAPKDADKSEEDKQGMPKPLDVLRGIFGR